MKNGVLIAYASKYGSTCEVAERIGDVFREEGIEADVRDVKTVKSLNGYRAAIVGGPVVMNKLRPAVVSMVKKHRKALQDIPTAYFTLGVTMKTDNLENRVQATGYLDDLCAVKEPVSMGLFAGKVDYAKIGALFRWSFQKDTSGLLSEGDFLDWGIIEQWARNLAQSLPVKGGKTNDAVPAR